MPDVSSSGRINRSSLALRIATLGGKESGENGTALVADDAAGEAGQDRSQGSNTLRYVTAYGAFEDLAVCVAAF